ncbi:MAG: hypothetical protein LBB94_10690 [Clostridiales bacterium]|jgi:hypothetical protein|nr:hypothetical protein [Clostridiales bacterium]
MNLEKIEQMVRLVNKLSPESKIDRDQIMELVSRGGVDALKSEEAPKAIRDLIEMSELFDRLEKTTPVK